MCEHQWLWFSVSLIALIAGIFVCLYGAFDQSANKTLAAICGVILTVGGFISIFTIWWLCSERNKRSKKR